MKVFVTIEKTVTICKVIEIEVEDITSVELNDIENEAIEIAKSSEWDMHNAEESFYPLCIEDENGSDL